MITIKTNASEVYGSMAKKLESLTKTDKILREAALLSLARIRVRVFSTGQNSAKRQIGRYSDHKQPYYWFTNKTIPKVFQNRLRKYASKGKTGTIYFNVKNHKQVRQLVGRQVEFVDLEFTGQMRGGFLPIPGNGRTTFGLGWPNPVLAKRAAYNEERYGYIFSLTTDELNAVINLVALRSFQVLRKKR